MIFLWKVSKLIRIALWFGLPTQTVVVVLVVVVIVVVVVLVVVEEWTLSKSCQNNIYVIVVFTIKQFIIAQTFC